MSKDDFADGAGPPGPVGAQARPGKDRDLETTALRLEALFTKVRAAVSAGVGKGGLELPGMDASCRALLADADLPALSRGDDRPAPGVENLYLVTEIYPAGGHRLLLEQLIRSRPQDRHTVVFTGLLNRTRTFSMTRMADLGVPAVAPDPQAVLWDKWMWLRQRLAAEAPQRVFLLHHSEDVLATLVAQEIAPAYGRRLIVVRHADTVASLGADLMDATHLAIRPAQKAALARRWPDLGLHLLPLCFDADAPAPRVVAETPVVLSRATDFASRRLRLRRSARELLRQGVWAGRRAKFSTLHRVVTHRRSAPDPSGALVTATCGTEHKFALTGPLALPRVLVACLQAKARRHVHIGPASPALKSACYAALREAGIARNRLCFAGEVPSVAMVLQWHRVGLFLGSFPVGGALSRAEAAWAGIPIALLDRKAEDDTARYMSGTDFAPEQVLRWTGIDDLTRSLENDLSPQRRAMLGRASREWYDRHLSPEQFTKSLDALVQSLPSLSSSAFASSGANSPGAVPRAIASGAPLVECLPLRFGPEAGQAATPIHPASSVRVARPRVVATGHIAQESQVWETPLVRAACWTDAVAVGGADGFVTDGGAWIDPGLEGFDPHHIRLRNPGPVRDLKAGRVDVARLAAVDCIPAAVLACGCYSHNYYHFLLEVLPRALAAARIAPSGTPILTEDDLPVQCYQALRLALPDHPVFRIARNQSLTVNRLYSAGMGTIVNDTLASPAPPPAIALRYHPSLVAELASLRKAGQGGESPKRLFLWRASRARTLRNAVALRHRLEERGFHVVDTSSLSFADQIRLMANAEVVVAQSGAQLTNILFAPPGCRVIALFSDAPGINYRLWSALGGLLGHKVINIAGPHVHGPSGIHADFSVPEDLLLPLIDVDLPHPLPFGVSDILSGLSDLCVSADVLTGSWAVVAGGTPRGFAARLSGLRRGAVSGVAGAEGSALSELLAHRFFADYGRNLRSGFMAFADQDAAERAQAARAV
ncbi:glycosyltransferase family 61 protein, partial [Sulfitobacter sabulilitoris]